MNRDDFYKDFLDEEPGRMPEPAPGKKVISFSLPEVEEPRRKPARKKAKEEPVTETDFTAANEEDYKDLSASPRRRAREVSLMLLFAVAGGSTWELAETVLTDTGIQGENVTFASMLARNAYDRMAESDALLARYAKDWDVSRFSAVDRNILRLSIAELFALPEKYHIAINEAVELGKKFSSDESAAFVNGILDRICKEEIKPVMEKGAAEAEAAAEAQPVSVEPAAPADPQ